MPFNSNLNGYLLTPKTTIETQFQLKLNKNQNTDFAMKDFNSKKSLINHPQLRKFIEWVKNQSKSVK